MKTNYFIGSIKLLFGKRNTIFKTCIVMFLFFVNARISTVAAQDVLFDFNNAPLYSSLPINLTVSGITAHFSATGQGYSVQNANVLGFTPQGFDGRILYPNSINYSDIIIQYDQVISDFSIMYACQELGCDDAATMRVTAYMNGVFAGTSTKTARFPGTWPVDTLRCSIPSGFNKVVVHYDSRPPTCQDYGVIYLADNMRVTGAASNPLTLNLTSIIEGFWDGISMINDSVKIYLRNAALPFSKVDSAMTVLDNSGYGVLTFSNAPAGNYYIVVSHRNSIDTWSGQPQTFYSGGSANYDFTTSANQAYGINMVLRYGKYCIYSGDVNKDGFIDLNDQISIFDDGSNYISGYVVTDVNGNGIVDLQDMLISYNNSVNFITVIAP